MNIEVLSFSSDFGLLRSLLIGDPESGRVAVLGEHDEWDAGSLVDQRWASYWALHAAVGKQDFEWLIQPKLDSAGVVRNALLIDHNQLTALVEFLGQPSVLASLPFRSAEELRHKWSTHRRPRVIDVAVSNNILPGLTDAAVLEETRKGFSELVRGAGVELVAKPGQASAKFRMRRGRKIVLREMSLPALLESGVKAYGE